MAQDIVIGNLFETVLDDDIRRYNVDHADIKTAIQIMREVYLPNPTSLSGEVLNVANYDDVAHRCAYLHKYAPIHTAMVADMLAKALGQHGLHQIINELLHTAGRINLCCLGGGPGCDVIGLISILSVAFGFFQMSATIIDLMPGWEVTFSSLIKELRQGDYGNLSDFVQPQYFEWDYIAHNLLGKMSNDVNKAVQGAHLVTIVKFLSAAACKDTPEMLKKVFRTLKPGSLVLYIDNAGGGFHQLIRKCAQECNMITAYGPLKHYLYENSSFDVVRFGYTPCLETKVTVHMWRKSNGFGDNIAVVGYRNDFPENWNSRQNRHIISPPRRSNNRRANNRNRHRNEVVEDDEDETYNDACCVIL